MKNLYHRDVKERKIRKIRYNLVFGGNGLVFQARWFTNGGDLGDGK